MSNLHDHFVQQVQADFGEQQFSGTLIRDLEAAVDKRLRPCVNCGQPRGLHSHENLNCPSDSLKGPFFLQGRYCAEHGELPCVNTVRNLMRGND